MGTITPNIQIYIPADGEENYGTSFENGMFNIDNHDHSGPPKGLPISSAGLAAGSVTADKLNANVYGVGTVAQVAPVPGAIDVDGVLKAIFNLGSNGLITRLSSTTAAARTITGTANQITVTNGDGVSGNPTLSFPTTFSDSGSTTPTITYAGSSYTWTYVNQTGRWIRIGNMVFFQFYISTSATSVSGVGTDSVIVTGIPAPILPTTTVPSSVSIGFFNWGTIVGGYQVVGEFQTNGNILLHGLKTDTAGGGGIITVGPAPASSIIFGTGFYAIA